MQKYLGFLYIITFGILCSINFAYSNSNTNLVSISDNNSLEEDKIQILSGNISYKEGIMDITNNVEIQYQDYIIYTNNIKIKKDTEFGVSLGPNSPTLIKDNNLEINTESISLENDIFQLNEKDTEFGLNLYGNSPTLIKDNNLEINTESISLENDLFQLNEKDTEFGLSLYANSPTLIKHDNFEINTESISLENDIFQIKNGNLKHVDHNQISFEKMSHNIKNKNFTLLNGKYTSCDCSDGKAPLWTIYSNKITVEDDIFIHEGSTVKALDTIPVFYIPSFRSDIHEDIDLPSISYDSFEGTGIGYPIKVIENTNKSLTLTPKFILPKNPALKYHYKTEHEDVFNSKIDFSGQYIYVGNEYQDFNEVTQLSEYKLRWYQEYNYINSYNYNNTFKDEGVFLNIHATKTSDNSVRYVYQKGKYNPYLYNMIDITHQDGNFYLSTNMSVNKNEITETIDKSLPSISYSYFDDFFGASFETEGYFNINHQENGALQSQYIQSISLGKNYIQDFGMIDIKTKLTSVILKDKYETQNAKIKEDRSESDFFPTLKGQYSYPIYNNLGNFSISPFVEYTKSLTPKEDLEKEVYNNIFIANQLNHDISSHISIHQDIAQAENVYSYGLGMNYYHDKKVGNILISQQKLRNTYFTKENDYTRYNLTANFAYNDKYTLHSNNNFTESDLDSIYIFAEHILDERNRLNLSFFRRNESRNIAFDIYHDLTKDWNVNFGIGENIVKNEKKSLYWNLSTKYITNCLEIGFRFRDDILNKQSFGITLNILN